MSHGFRASAFHQLVKNGGRLKEGDDIYLALFSVTELF